MITPLRSLVLCGNNKQDMEDWLHTLRTATESCSQVDPGTAELLGGNHQWYATSHARPTYCNACRDALHGKENCISTNTPINTVKIIHSSQSFKNIYYKNMQYVEYCYRCYFPWFEL